MLHSVIGRIVVAFVLSFSWPSGSVGSGAGTLSGNEAFHFDCHASEDNLITTIKSCNYSRMEWWVIFDWCSSRFDWWRMPQSCHFVLFTTYLFF